MGRAPGVLIPLGQFMPTAFKKGGSGPSAQQSASACSEAACLSERGLDAEVLSTAGTAAPPPVRGPFSLTELGCGHS